MSVCVRVWGYIPKLKNETHFSWTRVPKVTFNKIDNVTVLIPVNQIQKYLDLVNGYCCFHVCFKKQTVFTSTREGKFFESVFDCIIFQFLSKRECFESFWISVSSGQLNF